LRWLGMMMGGKAMGWVRDDWLCGMEADRWDVTLVL